MLDIGFQELLIIMAIALLVFGPDRLPELGRRLGRAMREFRRASDEFRTTIETNLHLNENILPPSASDVRASAASEDATPVVSETPATAPSSAEPVAVADADVASGQDALEPFWTRRGGRLLHRRTCGWRTRVPETERVPVKAATDGWDLGLQPCPVCDPRGAEPIS